jgi:hypothetical protein
VHSKRVASVSIGCLWIVCRCTSHVVCKLEKSSAADSSAVTNQTDYSGCPWGALMTGRCILQAGKQCKNQHLRFACNRKTALITGRQGGDHAEESSICTSHCSRIYRPRAQSSHGLHETRAIWRDMEAQAIPAAAAEQNTTKLCVTVCDTRGCNLSPLKTVHLRHGNNVPALPDVSTEIIRHSLDRYDVRLCRSNSTDSAWQRWALFPMVGISGSSWLRTRKERTQGE